MPSPTSEPNPAGLLLTPGATGGRDHAALLAVEQAVAQSLPSFKVLRHEFAYRRQARQEGKRRVPPPAVDKVVDELVADYEGLAALVGVAPEQMVLGGRSFGGRVCSIAVARGLPAAGLVLLSYPLHPPKKPERLRTDHFAGIEVPCLFVSSYNDPFGTPAEFEQHLAKLAGRASSVFIPGGGHDPGGTERLGQICAAVVGWLSRLGVA